MRNYNAITLLHVTFIIGEYSITSLLQITPITVKKFLVRDKKKFKKAAESTTYLILNSHIEEIQKKKD